jgi:hypothetical protein
MQSRSGSKQWYKRIIALDKWQAVPEGLQMPRGGSEDISTKVGIVVSRSFFFSQCGSDYITPSMSDLFFV